MFLIDTDVLSALRKPERNPAIVRWIRAQRTADLHVSVVTVGEIERGVASQWRRDPALARVLAAWLDTVISLYNERILPIDFSVARRWGRLCEAVGHGGADLLIAATAIENGLTVVTRNVRHFEPAGATVLDPTAVG